MHLKKNKFNSKNKPLARLYLRAEKSVFYNIPCNYQGQRFPFNNYSLSQIKSPLYLPDGRQRDATATVLFVSLDVVE